MQTTPATSPPDRRRTLMTVHAHPDDETIGTGGVMAKGVADGHRVVLVTCTRGELGEIVDPELDTPQNHRRLGEIRAAELEAAMGALGVTEWENLGYRDSGMMGESGNRDPRSFWQADRDEAIGRLVWMVRRYRPDVITAYNSFGGYGHPDHVNAHRVAVGAFYRAGDPEWYPEQLAPEHGGTGLAEANGGLGPWAPAKLYEQAMGRGRREALGARMEAAGVRSFWSRPDPAATRRSGRPPPPSGPPAPRVDRVPWPARRASPAPTGPGRHSPRPARFRRAPGPAVPGTTRGRPPGRTRRPRHGARSRDRGAHSRRSCCR